MSLIAHYPLNGNAKDLTGQHDGNVVGGVSWINGKIGKCADFDGSTGYISDPRVSDYLHGRAEASIVMWVKKDAVQYGFLQLSGYASSNGNLYPYDAPTKVYLDVFRTNRLGPIYLPTSTLEWHHVVITQSPGVWKLYQNGELVHSTSANQTVATNYLSFEIGRNSGGRYADGQFDDVRVYDHALSEREVKDLAKGLSYHFKAATDNQYVKNYLTDATNSNTALDAGAWVGPTTDTGLTSSLGTPILSYTVGTSSYTYTQDQLLDDNFSALSSKLVTFSLYMRRVEGAATGRIRMYDNVSSYSYHSVATTTEFQKFEMQKTIGANPTRIFCMIDSIGGGTYEFHSPQVEISPFANEFTFGERIDDVTDATGNEPNITLQELSPKFDKSDKIVGDGSYVFTPTNFTHIDIPNTSKCLSPGLSDFSVVFWMKSSSVNNERILSSGNHLSNFEIWKESTIRATIADGSTRNLAIGGIPIGDNQWHHVAIRYDRDGDCTAYIDGILDVNFTLNIGSMVNIYIDPSSMFFGRYDGNGYQYDGNLQDFKIYMTHLSDEAIKEEFQTGLAVDDHHRMHSAYLNELFEFDYLSPKSSSEVASAGNGYNATSGESDPCSGLLTFDDAVAYAEAQGARLPTKNELENDATAGSGCSYDSQMCWSCTKGVDDSEHWVVIGLSTNSGAPEVRKNTETAYVRFVYDNDLERSDPVTIDDAAVQKIVGSGATKIERGATKKDQFSEVGITREMVSWFPLKGDAKDRVSNEVATVNGAVPTGDGYSFDGVDDFVQADNTNLGSVKSISVWVKSDAFGQAVTRFIVGLGTEVFEIYQHDHTTNGVSVLVGNGSTVYYQHFPNIIESGFVHLVGIDTGNGVELYKNGVKQTNQSTTGTYVNSTVNTVTIGQRTNGSLEWDGLIRDVKIFNTALTPEEVAQEYQSSSKSMINKSTAFAKEFIEV